MWSTWPPVPSTTADDELVARRRDVRGAKRREEILQLLQTGESGALSVEEIAERFGVSFATVRRDLSRLHQDRHITRTYGGVALTGPAEVVDPPAASGVHRGEGRHRPAARPNWSRTARS